MTPQPPSGHDPASVESSTRTLVASLLSLSQEILAQSSTPDLPQLSQLILQRGALVSQIATLPLSQLSPAVQAELQAQLTACQQMDTVITEQMAHFEADIAQQLKVLKEAHTLLDKYRSEGKNQVGTRSENA